MPENVGRKKFDLFYYRPRKERMVRMVTKHKMGGFNLMVYEEGFSVWHNGIVVVDASLVKEDGCVIVRTGGDARLKVKEIKLPSPNSRVTKRVKDKRGYTAS